MATGPTTLPLGGKGAANTLIVDYGSMTVSMT
ncbi:hypothetical protein SPHINGO391_390102 [Sphingomonas aurantiaca]|uniref:Uncharacterized protein n=1 Tax=Sphingomonas aurantiaca TaxID=185949 RepID=A0A5E7YLZ3_9SPHN|nr:hypothetical protein SPHINGO391_390102 [Sphingomonas aurantiaca]